MGVGEAVQDTQEGRRRGQGAAADRRPEAGDHARARSRSPPSSCARTCRSAARSRLRASACTSSSTGWSTSRCRACATSAASRARASTAAAITRSGLKEQIVFPEINYDQVDAVRGMDIIICTTAKTDAEAQGLARRLRHAVRQLSRSRTRSMAKTSSIEQEPASATQLAKRSRAKRARLKAIAEDRVAAAGGAFRRAAEAGRAAAQFVGDAHPQPLRADRPAARQLPQVQAVAHRAARTGLAGPDPRHGQVELVRENAACR